MTGRMAKNTKRRSTTETTASKSTKKPAKRPARKPAKKTTRRRAKAPASPGADVLDTSALPASLAERLEALDARLAESGEAEAGALHFERARTLRDLERHDDAIASYGDAADAFGTIGDSAARDRARAYVALAHILRGRARDRGAAAKILDGLADADEPVHAAVAHFRGLLAFAAGDRQAARLHLLRAVKAARRSGRHDDEALAYDSLSDLYRELGEAGRSEAYLFKALELKRLIHDYFGQAVTLGLLGKLCLMLERYPKAQHYLEEGLTLSRECGDARRVASTMGDLGRSMVGQGKLDQADKKLKMGLMFAKRLRDGERGEAVVADITKELAEVARRSGRLGEARKRLDTASETYRKANVPGGAAITDCLRANIHFEQGDPRSACTLLEGATKVLRKHGGATELVPALGLMAQAKFEVGQRDDAIAILTEASKVARKHCLFRELEAVEREKGRLEQTRPDQGHDGSSLRFFREFCLYGMRGTVKEYKIIREIGEGTAGVVYEAMDEAMPRRVAIKMLKPSLSSDAEQVARFRRELEAVGLVDHPAVMKIYACGRNDDRFFYVTDYLPGPSLHNRMQSDGAIAFDDALPLMRRVADAVAAVHHAGVVHRDLKPGNMLLDGDGEPVVVDFGIAGKRGKVPSAEDGAIMGTFLYMPLEAMNPRAVPAFEWDVFALGVSFFELLTGRLPFPAETFPALVERLQEGKPATMKAAHAPAPVRKTIGAMLAKDPADRPTASAVAEVLAAL